MPTSPRQTLERLGLSESEISTYLALTQAGALTVRELIVRTHQKRPTAYYALNGLKEKGLVHATGQRGAERYQAEDPKHLVTLLTLRRHELEDLERDVTTLLPSLVAGHSGHESLPGVSFFTGELAMKQAIMETLECRGQHIDSIAPADNFFWQVGQGFSARYIAERVKRGITTRNLWEQPLRPEIMLRAYRGRSSVRILPRSMIGSFKTTTFLYDDTVMSISSLDAGFALVVRSEEYAATMRAIYEGLWGASTDVGRARS